MRTSRWILASFGVLGLGLGLALAGGPAGGATGQAADGTTVSLTDPIPTAPAADCQNGAGAQAGAPRAHEKSGCGSCTAAVATDTFDGLPARDANLIHAEYSTQVGKAEGGRVRQVQDQVASPFDESADPSVAIGQPPATKSARDAHPSSNSVSHLPAAPATSSSSALQVGLDPSQIPVITTQWVKKSPLCVGQECACDLVIKNGGKVPAKELSIDAFFPATVRLTHAEPMPTDNQDHVTWAIPALGAGEERAIHITLVPAKRGELGTTA